MNINKRIPRPKGLTHQAQNKNNNKERRELIEKEILKEYIDNNYTYLGSRYSMENFSTHTGIPYKRIQDELILRASDMEQMMDGNEMRVTLRAITNGLFRGALADRALAQHQQSLLLDYQGNTYRPFVSQEVNQSMQNLFRANDMTLKILKALLPTNAIEALTTNDLTKGTSANNGLTREAALEVISEAGQKPLLESPDAIEALEKKHNLSDMPEVIAGHQKNYNAEKEGLDFKDITAIQLKAMREGTKVGHTDRRAHEINEDLDSDHIE